MSDSLKKVQNIYKLVQIISLITTIVCAVESIISIVSLIALSAGFTVFHFSDLKTGSQAAGVILLNTSVSIIGYIGAAIAAYFSMKYAASELKTGQPFTAELADQAKKTGIYLIIIYFATLFAQAMIQLIFTGMTGFEIVSTVESGEAMLIFGLVLLAVSMICRYGAELKKDPS